MVHRQHRADGLPATRSLATFLILRIALSRATPEFLGHLHARPEHPLDDLLRNGQLANLSPFQRHGNGLGLPAADDRDLHLVPAVVHVQQHRQLRGVDHQLIVELVEHVVFLQAGIGGWAVGLDVVDDHPDTLRQSQLLAEGLADGRGRDAQERLLDHFRGGQHQPAWQRVEGKAVGIAGVCEGVHDRVGESFTGVFHFPGSFRKLPLDVFHRLFDFLAEWPGLGLLVSPVVPGTPLVGAGSGSHCQQHRRGDNPCSRVLESHVRSPVVGWVQCTSARTRHTCSLGVVISTRTSSASSTSQTFRTVVVRNTRTGGPSSTSSVPS